MTIRFSKEKDFHLIKKLWNEAFGDSESDIQFFLDGRFNPINTLILEENGEIASMLFLIEGKMHINHVDYPSYYLYAACTSKKFRGRGFMVSLLSEAKQISSDRGIDFICLMPGEESLFDFYKKNGYFTAFNKKVLFIDKKNNVFPKVESGYCHINSEELRDKAFAPFNYFKWDKNSIDFAIKHNKLYGGELIASRKGFCLYNKNGNEINVKEFAFTEKDFEHGLNLLASVCDSDRFVLNLPSQYKTTIDNFKIMPSAMLCPVTDKANLASAELKNAYLGLTLD